MRDPESGDAGAALPPGSGAFGVSSGAWRPDEEAAPRYRRERRLGAGGMGEVWAAEDTVLRREVAVKWARADVDPELAERLLREARIMATLDHPGIVPVHDAGIDAEGRPYYTMRVVRGQRLDQALAEKDDLQGRLGLLRHVLAAAEAVAYAHDAGIIHRDLKPSNILLGPYGETQVMDWGLARPVDREAWAPVLDEGAPATTRGVVLGTPAYMSPEQASGEPVGPPSDVWSLGVILYELAAGSRAYDAPSSREILARLLAGPPPPLPDTVPGPLRGIVARALEPEPARRYPTAGALAADLEAYLDGRRVSAYQDTPAEIWMRRLRRWRWPLLGLAAAVVVGIVVGAVGLVQVDRERRQLREARLELQDALDVADRNLARALIEGALAAVRDRDEGRAQILAAQALALTESPDARGILAVSGGHPRLVHRLPLEDCVLGAVHAESLLCADGRGLRQIHRDGTTRWLGRLAVEALHVNPRLSHATVVSQGMLHRVALASPDGAPPVDRRDLYLDRDNTGPRLGTSRVPETSVSFGAAVPLILSTWGIREHRRLAPCGPGVRPDEAVLLAPDDLLIACPGGRLIRGAGDAFVELQARGNEHDVFALSVDAPARRVAIGEMLGQVRVLDLDDGEVLLDADLGQARVEQVALSAEGDWVAARVAAAGTWLFHVRTGQRHRLPVSAEHAAFDRDGALHTWTGEAWEVWAMPEPGDHGVVGFEGVGLVALSWGPHGLGVATGDGVARVRPATDQLEYHPMGHMGVKGAEPTADGTLWAGSLKGLYRLSPDGDRERMGPWVRRLQSLGSGHLLVAGRPTRIFDPSAGEDVLVDGFFRSVEARSSPDGGHAVVLGEDRRLLHVRDGDPPRWRIVGRHEAIAVAVGDGGWPVYLGGEDGVDVLDSEGEVTRLVGHDAAVLDLAVSPDGRFLAGADGARRVVVWRTADGALVARMRGHRRRVVAVAFSPDGRWLASGSWDDQIRFWDVAALDAAPSVLSAQVAERWGDRMPGPR